MKQMNKFVIVGFPKCGQNSLIEYLRAKYNLPVTDNSGSPLVTKSEFIWKTDAVEQMTKWDAKGYKCVIIKREPVDRIWSSYYYFGYYTKMSYENYLEIRGYHRTLGEENPLLQSDYDHWIDRLKSFKPLVYDLEEILKESSFPVINKTEIPEYKPIPDHLKQLTIQKLETLI